MEQNILFSATFIQYKTRIYSSLKEIALFRSQKLYQQIFKIYIGKKTA